MEVTLKGDQIVMFKSHYKHYFVFRFVVSTVNLCFILSFITSSPRYAWSQSPADLGMPIPGIMVNLTPAYVPILVKGLRVHPDNPVLFDFMMDIGNTHLKASDQELKMESEKLIKYFFKDCNY